MLKRLASGSWLLVAAAVSANDILEQIRGKLIATDLVQGRFVQEKRLKFLRKPLESQGEFTFWQGHGLLWQTQSPIHSSLLLSGNRMVSADGEHAIPAAFGHILPALLSGELDRLDADFNFNGSVNANTWRLQLTPVDPMLAKMIASIEVSGDHALRHLQINETTGNQSLIRFERISHPPALSAEQRSAFEQLSP